MTAIRKSALVPYSAGRMYELVDDIDRYPEFLPWCDGARVESREPGRVRAELSIGYRGLRERFSTENLLEPGRAIRVRLVSGPFSRLQGEWRFAPLGESGCRVDFEIEYEFSSRLIGRLLGPVFDHIANTMVDAFIRRAERLHG